MLSRLRNRVAVLSNYRSLLLVMLVTSAISIALTYPADNAGIHDSDSALYIVEAISLDQTSPLALRPEWNTVMRVATLPWGGMHIFLLKVGLGLSGYSETQGEFHAYRLYWFWSGVAVGGVVMAAILGYLLRGIWGAVWASVLIAANVPHVKLYTQFNQVGSYVFFSQMLLLVGAWYALHREHKFAAVALGVVSFVYPFSNNLFPAMLVTFPLYLWLLLPRPNVSTYLKVIMPFVAGTGLAIVCLLFLTYMRYVTGATVYTSTLLHFTTRVVSLISRQTEAGMPPSEYMTLWEAGSVIGAGGTFLGAIGAVYAVLKIRSGRELCLVPVALVYAVPLFFVSKDTTLVVEYFLHSTNLIYLATSVILAHIWSAPIRHNSPSTSLLLRVATGLFFIVMLLSTFSTSLAIRQARSGEDWALLGSFLAQLPAEAVIASTAEQEVGILYSGKRILTRNDTSADTLLTEFQQWPGKIDYLVIRGNEISRYQSLLTQRGLEAVGFPNNAVTKRWMLFGPPEARSKAVMTDFLQSNEGCRRQPYIPYHFDAGWRYASDSLLRKWGTAGLLYGDSSLWMEWSQATRLPYERFDFTH